MPTHTGLLLPLSLTTLLLAGVGCEDKPSPEPDGPPADSDTPLDVTDSGLSGEDTDDADDDTDSGLSGDDTDDDAKPEDAPPVYLAFSGGGWHSHTAMAGWLAGMLEASKEQDCDYKDLNDIFHNVSAIAANSGGSWFMTQLAWSNDFRVGLESNYATWATDGFLGQTEYLFFGEGTEPVPADLCERETAPGSSAAFTDPCEYSLFEESCIISGLTGSESLNWQELVEGVVYCPYNMNNTLDAVALSDTGSRQTWSGGKDLLVASALLADTVVLEAWDSYNELYNLEPDSGQFILEQVFTPLYFSSIDSGRSAPALLGEGDMTAEYGEYSYWEGDYVWSNPQSFSATTSADVSVIEATVASSAAAAAVASQQALSQAGYGSLSGELSYYGADLAPSVRFTDAGLIFPGGVRPANRETLSDERYARTADGGYVDNTAVGYLLRHMADNGPLEEGFEVVLFMNNTSDTNRAVGGHDLPESVAVLFGVESSAPEPIDCGPKQSAFCSGFCVCVPKNTIFELDTEDGGGTSEIWSHSAASPSTAKPTDEVALRYLTIDVKTVEEGLFGLPDAVSGTLHLFTNEHFNSSAMPSTQEIQNSYKDVYDVTREAVRDYEGYTQLGSALGLQCRP